jgi:hypothetical protein
MKKFLSFFAFVAIMISFAACGGGNEPELATLQLKVQALSHKAYFVITPSANNQQEYFFCWTRKSEVEEKGSVEDYAEYYLNGWSYENLNNFQLFRKGKMEYCTAGDYYLVSNTTFVLFACYIVKEGDKAKRVSDVESIEFTTLPEYTLNGEFTVDAQGKKVRFMQANMYQPSNLSGLKLMENQWDCVGSNSSYPRDLFTWDQAMNALPSTAPYHLLPANEWAYLFRERPNAERLFAHATLSIDGNDIHGLILLPDNWEKPDDIQLTTDFEMEMLWDEQEEQYRKTGLDGYSVNNFDKDQWESLEFAGAVFLPAAGSNVSDKNTYGNYWSSTPSGETDAHRFAFGSYYISLSCLYEWRTARTYCHAVRPVREIK